MDDLDHSIHIAECDWTSFYEDSEECSLLKPSIAYFDNLSLSDSEDSENSSPVFTKPKEESVTQANFGCPVYPAGNTLNTEEMHVKTVEGREPMDNDTNKSQAELLHAQSAGASNELEKDDEGLQTILDTSINDPDSSFLKQTQLNVNEPHATEGAAREDVSSVNSRAEKERWFVTVNDSPARQWVPASSVKKKQHKRQKKTCKSMQSSKQETCVELCLEIKDRNVSEERRDMRDFSQLKQTLVKNSGGAPSVDINPNSSQMSCKEETASEKLVISNFLKEHITQPVMARTKHEPGGSALISQEIFTLKDPSQAESAESDELEDGVEANKMPDDNSTCDNDTHSKELCTPSDTLRLQKQEMHLSASGSSSGYQLSPLPAPDLTLTPCSVANSSETYAEAAGRTRPVYAISAFWDEMEKLTINDILHLRKGRSTPLRETEETVTPNVHGCPTNPSFLVDTVEYNMSDGGLIDTSDTADSDYFTQPDESKPECSSCEFSTSDFEEEYWQFIGTSRNASPDPQDKNQPSEELCSEGKETPDLSHSLFLCRSQSENMGLKASDSLETPIPAPVLSMDKHYQISIPEVFEYFFTEDEANSDSRCVTVYDPQDIPVAPVFDCTLCTLRGETPFSSLRDSHCSEPQPIPIFSCCLPTVRELTFPKPDYVFLNEREEDDFSPIRVVSHCFAQAGDSWKRLLSIRKICFHDKGSVWCRRSGAWVFPVEADTTFKKRKDPPVTTVAEGRVSTTPTQLFEEQVVQQRIWETIHKTKGIFSTLKQSDMCLVCIAFASWVLRSSDPEAADAWKAALLANMSALSAIQFLRQYVKKNPLQDI
uniref:PGC-1 and ERR-induced regulator in muscle protein 1 n=1 Tax=Anabas testudineus TaxID=64144 RepID=A0A3Q1JLF5_ANATE